MSFQQPSVEEFLMETSVYETYFHHRARMTVIPVTLLSVTAMRFNSGARLARSKSLAPLGAGEWEVYRARHATRSDCRHQAAPERVPERARTQGRALPPGSPRDRPHHAREYLHAHDVGEDGSAIFCDGEIDGATLAQRLEDGPLPPLALRTAIRSPMRWTTRIDGVVH